MTHGIDNDQWLRNIGAVTVHDDDDRRDESWPRPDVSDSPHPAPDGEAELASGSRIESAEMPFDDEYHDYGDDGGHDSLLTASFELGDPVDLDSISVPATAPADSRPARRFTPWVVGAFGAAAALAMVITLVITMANSPGSTPSKPAAAPVAARVVEAAPPSPPPNTDGPLPFTASSDCPAGSTSAQSVADPNSTTPWVCVRSVDGQVLQIDLGRTFVITAVSIVPGAVNRVDNGGGDGGDQTDPWLQHRVVTRLQWQFNDTDRTVKSQNTGNVRGEAVEPIRPGVLASRITVIIQETSRPPVIAPSGTTPTPGPTPPGAGSSILGSILGDQGGSARTPAHGVPDDTTSPDPADGTFAVASVKIIGHKAV
ncbi:discoidin domain-containing protein [Mycolicibacterium sphagni]|uniref:Discoidin domain-containing protein n=1 Tax=Mycolicibacterium sphagni TaxID=1786 RepID=A0ABX2K0P2_9MYCO|nr:discoidin domain-containing protein [Mycolicibacterium sphagni]NTY62542.1 discoidin domain-containing protein [Mycolicibacterium sphagni]